MRRGGGGRSKLALAMEEFNYWVDSCGLLEMQFSGQHLSWCKGHVGLSRSWASLDHSFLNVAAFDVFPDAHMKYLARTSSDHAPMQVSLEKQLFLYGYPSFKFQQMWVSHAQYFGCVSEVWNGEEVRVSRLYSHVTKLKRLKVSLRT